MGRPPWLTGDPVHLRNGAHGYGVVTKVLHWLTVLAIAAQFAIGLTMDADAGSDRADEQVEAFEEGGEERAERQGEATEERFEAEVERREEAAEAIGYSGGAFEAHRAVGLLVLVLGLLRLVWRRTTPLPPWAEHLSARERTVESWLEKALLTLLVLVPLTGLSLVLLSDDLVVLHVAAQVALLLVVTGHVALVLKHTVLQRDRHLSRML
jgi:cytochrome b561